MKMQTKEKTILMWSILLIAMVQMPSLALSPSINQIKTVVFPEISLSTIQTIMQLPNFISPFITILTAYLIGKGVLAKKTVIVSGLLLVAVTGALSLVCHSQLWHYILLSACLGFGLSGYISTASSLIVDHFSVEERQKISGFQTSFINGGGILMSLCGGLLATIAWYGGYLMLMIALPVAILAIFAIPSGKANIEQTGQKAEKQTRKVKLKPDVFLYAAFIFVYMLVSNVIGSNLSTHIAGIGNTSIAGYCTAIQMCGGVICGLFFGKLSKKFGDYTATFAFLVQFIGMTLLSLFQNSLPMILLAVFIAGSGMSMMLPQCLFSVSKVVDENSSALATSITSCIAPSGGGFFSAIVFTNLTTKLYGDSTVMRYRFVSFVALACAVIVFIIVTIRKKRETAYAE